MRSFKIAAVFAALVLVFAAASPTLAKKKRNHTGGDLCAVIEAPLTAEQMAAAVDSALAAVPGTVKKVALRVGHAADGSEEVYLAIVIQDASDVRHSFYFDGSTGAPLAPPVPSVAFNDAAAAALALVDPGSLAGAKVLKGELVNEVIHPLYLFKIVDGEDRLVRVAVDAQSGAASVVEPEAKKRKRGGRGDRIRCSDASNGDSDGGADSDGDSDADSDGDSDGDSDSDGGSDD
jgi:hypothetical protein